MTSDPQARKATYPVEPTRTRHSAAPRIQRKNSCSTGQCVDCGRIVPPQLYSIIGAGPFVRYVLDRCRRNGCISVHPSRGELAPRTEPPPRYREATASRLTIRRPTMSNTRKCTRGASISIFAAPVLIVAWLASGSVATAQTSVSAARMKAIETCIAQARSQARGTMGGRRRHRELLYASCMYSKGQRP